TLLAIGIGIAGSAVAALIAWSTLRRGLQPLDRLGSEVDEIESESLTARLGTDSLPSELAPFAHRINELLERLETAFNRERRFGADLSHELRTPIAEIRSTAEFAKLYPARAGSEDFESILETTVKLQSIVETQLELARLETDVLGEQPREVDLVSLIESEWQSRSDAAKTRAITIKQDLPESLHVATQPEVMRTILGNLIGNAIAYSPDHSVIRLTAEGTESKPIIRCSNPAPELEEDDLPKLFERLWRKDSSRSDPNHTGLGLSLARAAANRLGFSLQAKLQKGEIEFVLSHEKKN
ncbi:MAG: ATP-binding protein, partial [Verrucomicrobiota bacterium]